MVLLARVVCRPLALAALVLIVLRIVLPVRVNVVVVELLLVVVVGLLVCDRLALLLLLQFVVFEPGVVGLLCSQELLWLLMLLRKIIGHRLQLGSVYHRLQLFYNRGVNPSSHLLSLNKVCIHSGQLSWGWLQVVLLPGCG